MEENQSGGSLGVWMIRKTFRVLALLGLAIILSATTVLAAYSAAIQVVESSNTSYTELPIVVSVDNDYLVTNGYITATGLDTRVESGGVAIPHLVVDDSLLFSDGISANTTSNYQYTTANTALADMPVIVGYNGYSTTLDDAALELGNNFEVEFDGYVDTSAGANKNLVIKTDSFRTYVSSSGNITATVSGFETLRPTGAGDLTQLTASAGANWDCVEETPTDEDGTYVFQLAQELAYEYDLYAMADSGIGAGTINSVTVYNRVRGTADNQEFFKTYIKTGGVAYSGTQTEVPVGYADYSTVYANNPGGGAWTWVQIDALQAGIGMINPSTAPRYVRCTQVWVVVDYTVGTVKAVGVASGEHTVTVKTELKTETFYSDAGVNSVDGDVAHTIALGTLVWNDLTTGVGTAATDGNNNFYPFRLINHADVNEYKSLFRGAALFDTAALPDTAVITSATLSIYGDVKVDPQNNTPNLNVYSSAPALDNALAAGDFNSLGAVAFCDTAITYAGFDDGGYNDFDLNAAGLVAIDVAGVSKFGFRNANYDVDNIAPIWAASSQTYFRVFAIEQGAGFAPKLVVSYYELVIYIDTVEEDREELGVGAPDNGNDWVIMQNNVLPYMDYMTMDVSGAEVLRYQPADIISGTTLIDETGTNDGIITWGANPAGLAVTIGGFVSESQPTPTITGADEATPDIAPTITQPSNYLTGKDMSTNPLYPLIKPLADLTGFNESWIWVVFATIIVLMVMILALAAFKSQLFGAIAGFALIALFYQMGIYPFWILIVYSMIAVGILVFERVQAV